MKVGAENSDLGRDKTQRCNHGYLVMHFRHRNKAMEPGCLP